MLPLIVSIRYMPGFFLEINDSNKKTTALFKASKNTKTLNSECDLLFYSNEFPESVSFIFAGSILPQKRKKNN